MAFGFEYEVLFQCNEDYVTFTDLKRYLERHQKKDKLKKPNMWTVVKDQSIEWRLHTWENSTDSPYPNKHKQCKKNVDTSSQDSEDSEENEFYQDGTVEIVSPILRGYDGIAPAFTYFDRLLARVKDGLSVVFYNNGSTSNHVHLSHPHLMDIQGVVKAYMAWVYFEPLFLIMVKEDRCANQFCKRVQLEWKRPTMRECFMALGNRIGPGLSHDAENLKALFAQMQNVLASNGTLQTSRFLTRFFAAYDKKTDAEVVKYVKSHDENIIWMFIDVIRHDKLKFQALNLKNLVLDTKTIEVRVKHGSNNMTANARWVQLLAVFFAAALDRPCVTEFFAAERDAFYKLLDVDVSQEDIRFLKAQFRRFVADTVPHAAGAGEAIDYWFRKAVSRRPPGTTGGARGRRARVVRGPAAGARRRGARFSLP
jgi:hypothetical protein